MPQLNERRESLLRFLRTLAQITSTAGGNFSLTNQRFRQFLEIDLHDERQELAASMSAFSLAAAPPPVPVAHEGMIANRARTASRTPVFAARW